MIQPTYYVVDIDGAYHVADPQPVLHDPAGPLVMQCSKCFGWGHVKGGTCAHCNGEGVYAEEPRAGEAAEDQAE